MTRRKSPYVVVCRRKHFSLAYPRSLWDQLDQDQQQAVIDRQQALFDKMQRANKKRGYRGRSKAGNV